ncbi:hypothetical protein D0T25_12230 [Duganella sp. BJB488]|nr:hypothetical protein D0T25_12230 [Duganella sp. BJB488]
MRTDCFDRSVNLDSQCRMIPVHLAQALQFAGAQVIAAPARIVGAGKSGDLAGLDDIVRQVEV